MAHRKRSDGLSNISSRNQPSAPWAAPCNFPRWVVVSVLGLITVTVGVLVGLAAISGNESEQAELAPVSATQGHIPYPLVEADEAGWIRWSVSSFDDDEALYYTVMLQDQPIEFFVLKSADGVVRSAFNACDVCYRSLKGYRQEGQLMVCNNCGSQFPTDQINVVRGGCNPSPLERSIQNEVLFIHIDAITAGAVYF